MIYRGATKRFVDIVFATSALLVFALPLVVSIFAIKLASNGPVFFFQTRVGLNGHLFRIIKLRTMTVNPNRTISQTTNQDSEVTSIGAVLRRLKIDELPQLINVLVGDMSFVGPRPCLEQTYQTMPIWARERFKVRPGITGNAQVNGNIALSWEERWKHDISYVENISLIGDLVIVFKTIGVIVLGEERFRRTL